MQLNTCDGAEMKNSILNGQMIRGFIAAAIVMLIESHPAFALGTSRLAATQAINGLSGEFAGPLAYSLSLAAIVGTAFTWYRHHHDMGALSTAGVGTLFVAGIALGATSLMGFVPGVIGATI